MKKLKRSCPFGGKQHPKYLLIGSLIFSGMLSASLGFSPAVLLTALTVLPLAVLGICFAYEQHLTPDEKTLVAEADLPLWQPLDRSLIESIRAKEMDKGSLLFIGLIVGVLLCMFVISQIGFNTAALLISAAIMIAVVIYILADIRESGVWANIDETAVYTDIPVHHMYDVKHRRTRGSRFSRYVEEWYENYIVFYLPDGRYTLHCREVFQQYPPTIRVIQFRGCIRWFAL